MEILGAQNYNFTPKFKKWLFDREWTEKFSDKKEIFPIAQTIFGLKCTKKFPAKKILWQPKI